MPAMIRGIRALEAGKAECIAIACHAAHHWYDELANATRLPIIHIADAVCAMLATRVAPGNAVGLIAASPTLRSGLLSRSLRRTNGRVSCCPMKKNRNLVDPAIKLVKGNQPQRGADVSRGRRSAARRRGVNGHPGMHGDSNRPCAGAKERGQDMRGRHRSLGEGMRCVVAFARRRYGACSIVGSMMTTRANVLRQTLLELAAPEVR